MHSRIVTEPSGAAATAVEILGLMPDRN